MAHVPIFFWVTEVWILVILKKEYNRTKQTITEKINLFFASNFEV